MDNIVSRFLADGQKRRAWLDETFSRLIPPELDTHIRALNMLNPVADIERAGAASRVVFDPSRPTNERIRAGGDMVVDMASVLAPAAAARVAGTPAVNALTESLAGFTAPADNAVQRFVADQDGASPRLFQNHPTSAPFDATTSGYGNNGGPRINATLESVLGDAHSRPEWSGAAPSRTTPYPRYAPARDTPRMDRLRAAVVDPENPIRHIFDGYITKGKGLGGEDWYNTEELRDWFVSELGDQAGDASWREFMQLIGATSTGAKVPQNIRMASFYRALAPEDRLAVAQVVKENGITPKAAAERLGVLPENVPDNYAYGHIKQRNQAGNVVNIAEGKWEQEVPEELTGAARSDWLKANPKVKGFGNDLLGDDTNIAADMHFMRMLAMADGGGDFLGAQAKLSDANYTKAAEIIGPRNIKNYTTTRMVNGKPVREVNLYKAWQDGRIKDTSGFQGMPTAWADTPKANEYAAYEEMANEVAAEYGMTPAQFQASLWMGAGDMTGLADESQGTFMQLFRGSLDKRAGERGISRLDMLNDFIHNNAPLAIGGVALGTSLAGNDNLANDEENVKSYLAEYGF